MHYRLGDMTVHCFVFIVIHSVQTNSLPSLPLPTSASAVNLLGDMSHVPLAQLEEMGVGLNVGIQWEEALHAALMPITPQCSMGSLAESETHTHVTTTALYATECAIACIYMYLCFGHQCSIYHVHFMPQSVQLHVYTCTSVLAINAVYTMAVSIHLS